LLPNKFDVDVACFNNQFLLREQFETGVEKRVASTYNSFGNNVAERIARFCCSYIFRKDVLKFLRAIALELLDSFLRFDEY